MSSKERYLMKKEAGVCMLCGSRDERTESGKVYCQACSDWTKKRMDLKRREAVDRKVCVNCGAQDERTLAGFHLCEECSNLRKVRKAERRERRIAEGRCTACGAKLPDGHPYRMCAECAEKKRAYMKNWKGGRK